jgi:drug/metabolite transporter (DMT)-like permease
MSISENNVHGIEKQNFKGYFLIILAQFLTGFIYILVKLGDSFGVYNLAFFRAFLSFIFIGILFIFSRKYKLAKIIKEKKKLFFFGFINALIIIAAYISIKYLSVAMAVLLSSTISIWMIVFSHFILKEKITKKTIIALIISFIGLIIIIYPENIFVNNTFIGIVTGLLFGIGGGFIYIISKTFKTYDKISLTFWQNLISVPFLIPLLFIKTPVFTFYNSFIALSLGLVGALSFIFIFIGFGLISGQKGGILNLLSVIFTILLGFIILGEIPTIPEIIGGIFIIIGSYLAIK